MGIIKERAKLNRAIRNAKTIFLMAHKNLDLDALGSQIGMYMLLKKKKKTIYIIIDDINHEMGVEKVLRELEGCINIIKSENIKEYLNPRKSKNLLIVLDTNKTELVQNKEVLDIVQNKIVIDHHEIGKTSIKNAIMINDNKISSTCEMIANLIEFYDVELESYYATILWQKLLLLKQDIEEYTERQKLMAAIETLPGNVAFTKATQNTIYRREDLAKVADTLLFFNNIEASFVIGKLNKNTIGISARSLGNYDISKILEKLGGGGDTTSGAAIFQDTTISKVEQELKKLLKEEGE